MATLFHGGSPNRPWARVDDLWNEAGLIPTTGIGGQAEQEQRATSALLAVLRAAPEFGRALLAQTGAPAGRIRTYIEVQFPDDTGKIPRPDGAVIVEWGKKRWIALLEVKTGGAPLVADQVNTYLDIPASRVAAATSMRRAVETAGFKSGQADRRTPIATKGAPGPNPEAPCCSGQLDPAAGGRLSGREDPCPSRTPTRSRCYPG